MWGPAILAMAFNAIPGDAMADISAGWDIQALIKDAAIAITIVGVIVFILGFSGFCGALNSGTILLVIVSNGCRVNVK